MSIFGFFKKKADIKPQVEKNSILIFFATHYLVSALMRILSILILLVFQGSICMDWKTISKA